VKRIAMGLAGLLAVGAVQAGGVCKHVDASGNVTFTNVGCEATAKSEAVGNGHQYSFDVPSSVIEWSQTTHPISSQPPAPKPERKNAPTQGNSLSQVNSLAVNKTENLSERSISVADTERQSQTPTVAKTTQAPSIVPKSGLPESLKALLGFALFFFLWWLSAWLIGRFTTSKILTIGGGFLLLMFGSVAVISIFTDAPSKDHQQFAQGTSQKKVEGKSVDAVDAGYQLCSVFKSKGIATKCEISGWSSAIDVVIPTNATEARQICSGVVDLALTHYGGVFKGRWELRISVVPQPIG
jgi:hypothetical protein